MLRQGKREQDLARGRRLTAWRRNVIAAALALVALAALGVGAATAGAATTEIFTFTGGEQTFTVPSGVTKIHVVAIGGRGAKAGNTGGWGAQVEGDLSVKPGQTLYVEVGGNGGSAFGENESAPGGFNGGGEGAGGGGGASDVRTNPRKEGLSPDTRLIVAGGGGGAGTFGAAGAGAGGAAGEAGESIPSNNGGGAGTASSGGEGGEGGCVAGSAGELGQGGAGGNCAELGGFVAGGGGGGLYGGGGGGAGAANGGAGGGGGSSLVPPGGALELAFGAEPEIRISYEAAPPPVEEPELGRCVATTGGKYTTATCLTPASTPGTGKFEWEPFPFTKAHFALTNGTATFKTAVNKTTISCVENVVSGEYTGVDSAALGIAFSGCKVLGPFGGVCTGAKAEAGEFSTAPLVAEFGVIDNTVSPPSLGWALRPAAGETFASFECGGTAVTISGSLIAPVTPVNKMTGSFKLAFSASGGIQKPTSFQGGEEQVLTLHTVNATEQVGLTMADSVANERLVELRAG